MKKNINKSPYGENPKSLGREEYLGSNKRHPGLGAENYKAPISREQKEQNPEEKPSSKTNSSKRYLQEETTPGNSRTDQNYLKQGLKDTSGKYNQNYSDELYLGKINHKQGSGK